MGARSASSTKRSTGTAASQTGSRLENGVVGSKKLAKQKSNGQLNGTAKSSAKPPPTPPLPGTLPPSNGFARPSAGGLAESKIPAELLRRSSLSGHSESSCSESYLNNANMIVSQENHRRIDVNAAKNPAVHRDAGPVSFLVTVLRSCPLYDTIAILIVLLQLPPTFLSIIHLLFATLTFVPPSTNSHSTFNFGDIFEGTIGTPSVATIIAVDGLVLLVWVFLWGPLQEISLDLAQTVIALTLGGGTSGKDAGFNNVMAALAVIGTSYFARSGTKDSLLRVVFPSSSIGSDPDDPLEPPAQISRKSKHGMLRTIMAIHILTQGIVRYIRDWYVRRERRDSLISTLDPEAGNGSISHTEHTANDQNTTPPNITTPDADSTGVIPMAITDKGLNPKKKRKASAQVRIRQPLWAALASTKIVMAKEYETSRTASESAGTNATDVNNLGNAPFDSEADRIWITYVGFDEVCFNTSFFPAHSCPQASEGKDGSAEAPGIDRSKPFFIRVNNTVWQPSRITVVDAAEGSKTEQRWAGEIFGLAPMSSYKCDFVSTLDESTIFSTSVRTMQAPTADSASIPMLSPSAPRSGRPDSPITTLKTSIATVEAKLTEERNRLKRERREQKSKINAARKDIDRLTASISSSGGNDDRLRQKVQQSNLHAKQAEDSVALLNSQIEAFENLPEDDITEWKSAKGAFQSQKDVHKRHRSEFNDAKSASERDLQALTAEVAGLLQKRDRMQTRITKLNGEHDRITDANARGLDEAQRKASERARRDADRFNTEAMYKDRLDAIEPRIHELQQNLSTIWASIQTLQHNEYLAAQAQAQASPISTMPNAYDIPEGGIPTTSFPWNPASNQMAFYGAANGPAYNSSPNVRRGRSSSMLSGVSGFTVSDVDDNVPYHDVIGTGKEGQKSEGSSGASGDSSSVGDPKSPLIISGWPTATPWDHD